MKTRRCSNCRRTITRKMWARFPLLGYLCMAEDEDGPEEHHEYRNCPCRSTLVARVDRGHAGPCTLR